MTTIAFDGHTLAVDSQLTSTEGLIVSDSFNKLYTLSNGKTITSTFDHPYYTNLLQLASFAPQLTNAKYELDTNVIKIKKGDVLYTLPEENEIGLHAVAVQSIEPQPLADTQTYIITVEDNHNFFANNILVHNK